MHFLNRTGDFSNAPRPSLIFLDYHLPKIDPRSILRFIKESEDLQKVTVIVLTTSNTETLIREAYGLGANCYLSKPNDLDDFFHTIRAAAEFYLNYPPDATAANG